MRLVGCGGKWKGLVVSDMSWCFLMPMAVWGVFAERSLSSMPVV